MNKHEIRCGPMLRRVGAVAPTRFGKLYWWPIGCMAVPHLQNDPAPPLRQRGVFTTRTGSTTSRRPLRARFHRLAGHCPLLQHLCPRCCYFLFFCPPLLPLLSLSFPLLFLLLFCPLPFILLLSLLSFPPLFPFPLVSSLSMWLRMAAYPFKGF